MHARFFHVQYLIFERNFVEFQCNNPQYNIKIRISNWDFFKVNKLVGYFNFRTIIFHLLDIGRKNKYLTVSGGEIRLSALISLSSMMITLCKIK